MKTMEILNYTDIYLVSKYLHSFRLNIEGNINYCILIAIHRISHHFRELGTKVNKLELMEFWMNTILLKKSFFTKKKHFFL